MGSPPLPPPPDEPVENTGFKPGIEPLDDAMLLDELRVVLDRRDEAQPAPESHADDLEGRQVGAYLVRRLLGEGGLSRVYEAAHPATDQRVAFKVLKPHYRSDKQICARFEREARSMAGIRHQHVVRILDIPQVAGIQAIVMDYLGGGSLRDRISQAKADAAPVPIDQAVAFIAQAAAGVGAAHAAGLVHRDIKPSNLLLDDAGRVQVADFGAILLLERATWLTGVGQHIGTPAYMSPEQCRGDRVTPGSDIYSLGATLFELLTGRLPFQAEEASPFAVMLKHISEPPPDPRDWRPELSDALSHVVLKSLSKEAGKRFSSAQAFAEALRSAPLKAVRERMTVVAARPAWRLHVATVRHQLELLPRHAIVCWACRCAQRVLPLSPDPQLERAIEMARHAIDAPDEKDSPRPVSSALSRIRALRAVSLQAACAHQGGNAGEVAVEVARAAAAAAASAASLTIKDAASDAAFAARSAIAALIAARREVKPFWDGARDDFRRLAAARLGKAGSMGKPVPRDVFDQ